MQSRALLELKFRNARNNLLLVIVFSAINVFAAAASINWSFLFSAFFPLFAVELGKEFAIQFSNDLWMAAGLIAAFLTIGIYVLSYFFSKKHRFWMLVALILFCIDAAFMALMMILTREMDILMILFHVWVIYYLVIGVKAWSKLNQYPLEEETAGSITAAQPVMLPASMAIRPVSQKGFVILSDTSRGMEIVVKRTFGLTELAVNGMVFAEKRGLIESNYELEAMVEGNHIKSIMMMGRMTLFINGEMVAQKMRLR